MDFALNYSVQGTLRPAQQEAGAGLAQGKLGRQLRTGRALLALGCRGGAGCLRRQQEHEAPPRDPGAGPGPLWAPL